MRQKNLAGVLLAAVSSLRLAVVTMVTLGAVCGYATFYEMRNGTPAVQRDIYQTPWFAFLLLLLGTNVLAVMVSRFPWTKHHIGFLTAHVGILAILAGSVLSLKGGLDSNLALFEGETGDRVSLLEKALEVSLPGGARASFPVVFEKHRPAPGHERRFAVPGTAAVLVADDYQPHVSVREEFAEAASGPPAVHLSVQAPMASEQAWLVPDDPQRGRLDLGMVGFELRSAASESQARELLAAPTAAARMRLVLGPGTALRFAARGGEGATLTGSVVPGSPIAAGWPGMAVSVDRLLAAATLRRSIVPETPPLKEERRRAAVRVHLERADGLKSEPEWLLFDEERQTLLGREPARVAFVPPQKRLPFRVTLLRFNNESYPGSRMASTYESTVRIDDPERGSFETLISMNHPLHYRGYVFFQSSFVEGRPMMSIFSVARAPGLPLVYLGVALVALGIIWMFYVKPYLARRQAAQALAARRRRGYPNEATAPDAVPAGARPGEPAPGGA